MIKRLLRRKRRAYVLAVLANCMEHRAFDMEHSAW